MAIRCESAKSMAPSDLNDSDVQLVIAAAQAGSDEAFNQLSSAYWDYLLLISRFGLDRGMQGKIGASDVVQETLLDAHRGMRGFRGSTEVEFVQWLRKILKNRLSAIRRRFVNTEKRSLTQEVRLGDCGSEVMAQNRWLVDSQTPSRNASASEDQAILQQALARLPEQYRAVLILRNLEMRSFEEVGQELNRTADAARMLWSRAMKQLQQDVATPHAPRPR